MRFRCCCEERKQSVSNSNECVCVDWKGEWRSSRPIRDRSSIVQIGIKSGGTAEEKKGEGREEGGRERRKREMV